MKKLTVIMLLAALLCTLTACAGKDAGEKEEPVISDEPVVAEEPVVDLTGPWHLDPDRNDLAGFSDRYECYAEFGASMEIRSDGQMSWYIGAEGGEGTWSVDGDRLTAELVRTLDESPMTTEFEILRDGDEVYLGMHWGDGMVFWSWGDDGSADLSGEEAAPAPENELTLVNRRGDEMTVYQLSDGSYMDQDHTVYTFDGIETWTDEAGVEWNEIVP